MVKRTRRADVDYGVALRRYKEQQVQHVDDRVLLEGRWLKLFKVIVFILLILKVNTALYSVNTAQIVTD
ncbi:hypothetical protein Tco_1350209 [Tanacetum coccineum]